MNERPLRVLICRPDHLGDLLLSLAALPPHDPGRLQIGVACSPTLAPIATRCPAVDAVVPIPFSDPAQPLADATRLDDAAATLRDAWDIALIPRIDDPQSGRLCAAASIPRRIGYDHPATLPYLTEVQQAPVGHVSTLTSHLFNILPPSSPAITHTPGSTAWIAPTSSDLAQATEVLAAHDLDARRLVLLHPGAGWALKRWPAANWAQVVAWLRAHALQVALTGIASERDLHDAIIAACSPEDATHIVSLAGAIDLPGMVGLVARARLMVAIDSGPLHLAAAVGTPLVGLYGPFGPALFGPLGDRTRQQVLTLRLPCQPCNTLETPPCGARTEPPCFTGLTPAAVTAAIDALLNTQPA